MTSPATQNRVQTETAKEFLVTLDSTQLKDFTQAIARENVNVSGFFIENMGGFQMLHLVGNDDGKLEKFLQSTWGKGFQRRDLLLVPAKNEPGQLGNFTQKLGTTRLEAAFPVWMGNEPRLAFAVDNIDQARKALGG